MNSRTVLLVLCSCFFVQACVSGPKGPPEGLLALTEAQMKIRSHQTRAFDIESTDKVVRGVVAALQDLGFIIERADEFTRIVSGDNAATRPRMTVALIARKPAQ